MATDRVVVIGASAGGVSALESVVATLPPDFLHPVLVVLHLSPTGESLLPEILEHAGTLRAAAAVDGEPLEAGRIYVASPDRHLMVERDRVRVTRGPKENQFRPSVDVLFRSAAYYYGSGAIGVVLSGSLSDGSSGLWAIRRLGGIAVIQDPDEALYSSMPLNAMRRVDIDYALPAAEMGVLLTSLVAEPVRSEPLDAAHYREDLKLDIDVAAADSAIDRGIMEFAQPSVYTCPECHGVLFRIKEGRTDRFRCHTGHGFSTGALFTQMKEGAEAALWQAVKTLQESGALLAEVTGKMREVGDLETAEELAQKAAEVEARLQQLRELALVHGGLHDDATPDAQRDTTVGGPRTPPARK
jgi:two-component system chemotaxis response regulator CheB